MSTFTSRGDVSAGDIGKKFIQWYENGTGVLPDEEIDKRKAEREKQIIKEIDYYNEMKAKIIREKREEMKKRKREAFKEFQEQYPDLKGEELVKAFNETYMWGYDKMEVDYVFKQEYHDFYTQYADRIKRDSSF